MSKSKDTMEQVNFQELKELEAKYGAPFYIMDSAQYKRNLNKFRNAFLKRYEKVIIGYSFKTNYVPALCQIAKDEGCYAEVVSEMEYELAMNEGFQNIIFNGPIKRPTIFKKAIENGAIINIDSEYEIDYLCNYKQIFPDSDIKVGIRINVNLTDENGNSTIQCGLRFGRFGFPKDILGSSIKRLRDSGVKIISLHGHTSSSDRAVLNYKIITQKMLSVCENYGLDDLEYFDIGGGFFGAAPNGMDVTGRPRYHDYANCILDEIHKNKWFAIHRPYIVIEPGSSVVSNVFSYITKVYQNKKVGNANFVMVDGSVFDVKPTMHGYNLPHEVYRAFDVNEMCLCDVVGSTCMEKDVMLKGVDLPRLMPGDFIKFNGVGAYTISLTPTFINFLAPILMYDKGMYLLIRRRQTIDDVLSIYNTNENNKPI